ncbi:MAG: hypothetical protein GC164_04610 [Phycisphaera sp.]|nr:hypothetical protein [Phycisphaera sp.]
MALAHGSMRKHKRARWITRLPWFGPAVMTVTMLLLLSLLIWRLQVHHRNQKQVELERALQTARDTISARLETDEEFLKLLAEQAAKGTLTESEFHSLASGYIAKRPRITAVFFVRGGRGLVWIVPEEYRDEASELSQSVPEHTDAMRAVTTGEPLTYSNPHIGLAGTHCFDLYVSTPAGGQSAGVFVASYNSRLLLRDTLDRSILQAHHTELCGEQGQVIYSTPRVARVDEGLIGQTVLLRPGNGMKLRLATFVTPFWDEQTRTLMIICVALVGGMGLGMWALSRQINERTHAEKALQEAYGVLEMRVEERTRELSETNRQLAQEIRDRQEVEEKSRRHMEQLAQLGRVSMMGEMAAGLAHELHQPLGAVATYLNGFRRLLTQPQPDLPRIVKALDDVNAQNVRAVEIIDRLRTFLTPNPPCFGPHNLPMLVREAAQLIDPDRKRMRIDLQTHIPDNTPTVLVDRVQIQQVIMNLVKNAYESIQACDPPIRRVTVSACSSGPEDIRVDVTDTGRGCPASDLQRIFEPFTTTKPGNMGMGLPICRTLIEAHNGRLLATNNPDSGMTFSFTVRTVQHVHA